MRLDGDKEAIKSEFGIKGDQTYDKYLNAMLAKSA
jgi:hypothetical protein